MNVANDPHRAYWEERLSSGPSLETVGWLSLGRGFNEGMYKVRAATFRKRVRRAFRKHGINAGTARVLDVGSGSGFYIEQWKRLGVKHLEGMDLTDAVVSALSARYPDVPFTRVDAGGADVEFPRECYDAISCMDVLFHIMDDAQYSRAWCNIGDGLKPGGIAVITENCLHGVRSAGPHQVSRTLDEVRAAIWQAGLLIVERAPAFVLMNTPVDSNNVLLHRFWDTLKLIVSRHEVLGSALSRLLFPLELLATNLLKEGPSTEFLICVKR